MITLSAKIEVNLGNTGIISTARIYPEGNNVSNDIEALVEDEVYGNNIFLLESSRLDDGSTFASEEERYYIGSVSSNDEGVFEEDYVLTIEGENIIALTLVFDTYNNEHPKTINVDGQDYVNEDNVFTVSVENQDTHTITIDNWNRANRPLRIQGIYQNIEIDVGVHNMLSISRNNTDRSDYRMPNWGIISNTCDIEFKDLNGEILDYIEQDLLVQGLKCEVFLNNTTTDSHQTIGVYYADSWNYNDENRVVSVALKDDLEEWQDINVEGMSYDPRDTTPKSLKDFYDYLHEKTPKKYSMKAFEEIDDEATKNLLSNTFIKYPMLNSGSLWQQWTKLCQVAQAHIYKNNNGKTVFVYNGGN